MGEKMKLMAEIAPEAVTNFFWAYGNLAPTIGEVVKGCKTDKTVLVVFGDGETRELNTKNHIKRMWEERIN